MTAALQQKAGPLSDRRLYNYRIEVVHKGAKLVTTVMELQDLQLLLEVSGHLDMVSIDKWLDKIFDDAEPSRFTLVKKSSVSFFVTATLDLPTQSTPLIH